MVDSYRFSKAESPCVRLGDFTTSGCGAISSTPWETPLSITIPRRVRYCTAQLVDIHSSLRPGWADEYLIRPPVGSGVCLPTPACAHSRRHRRSRQSTRNTRSRRHHRVIAVDAKIPGLKSRREQRMNGSRSGWRAQLIRVHTPTSTPLASTRRYLAVGIGQKA